MPFRFLVYIELHHFFEDFSSAFPLFSTFFAFSVSRLHLFFKDTSSTFFFSQSHESEATAIVYWWNFYFTNYCSYVFSTKKRVAPLKLNYLKFICCCSSLSLSEIVLDVLKVNKVTTAIKTFTQTLKSERRRFNLCIYI